MQKSYYRWISVILIPLLSISILAKLANASENYPSQWWKPFPRDQAASWEVLPQDAGAGEVVLSKRGELGVFSNLGEAWFDFEGVRYASVEALWQSMKYPDPQWPQDPRHGHSAWPMDRQQVYLLSMWAAKTAGDQANEIMKNEKFTLVSYKGHAFDYKDMAEGSEFHYNLIFAATVEKIMQNPELKQLLLKTKGLILIPDHHVANGKPKSYYYNKILMQIRDQLL